MLYGDREPYSVLLESSMWRPHDRDLGCSLLQGWLLYLDVSSGPRWKNRVFVFFSHRKKFIMSHNQTSKSNSGPRSFDLISSHPFRHSNNSSSQGYQHEHLIYCTAYTHNSQKNHIHTTPTLGPLQVFTFIFTSVFICRVYAARDAVKLLF